MAAASRRGNTRSAPRALARFALLALAALVALAVAGEIVLRTIAGEPSAGEIRTALALQNAIVHGRSVPHSDLGAVMAPRQDVWVETPEFRYRLRTDRHGFANREPLPERADVVVLGNSLLTGAGVGLDGQFTTLLEEAVAPAKVLNLGIPGGGTEHQYGAFRLYGAPLQPKVVVATLWLVYEIDNTLAFRQWLEDDARPDFATFSASFFAPNSPAGWRDLLRDAASQSVMATTLRRWARAVRGVDDPLERAVLANGDELLLSADEQGRLMKGWSRPGTPDAREILLDPLERLRTDVAAQGARLLVVLMPSKEEIHGAARLPELLNVAHEARRELHRRGFAVVDLYPAFQAESTARAAFFRADPHPNALGHRLVAQALAKAIGSPSR
jgi:hypothetical protein